MGSGILAGVFWAMETVLLGKAMTMTPFVSTQQAVFLAPFVSTFLHDLFSALWATGFNAARGEAGKAFRALRGGGKFVALAAVIGGPVGMTGYVLAVRSMGASVGAVASAAFPAVGAVLACIFLKEQMRWYRWLFLLLTLGGVYALSFSPQIDVQDFRLGIVGVLMCSLGWGSEAVILARCFGGGAVRGTHALQLRQTTSALIYGAVLLPALGGWPLTVRLVTGHAWDVIGLLALAALCAALSYSFYYRAIRAVGASRAMALDVTYAAWAIPFSALLNRDAGVFQTRTVVCMLVVLVCGVLAAADYRELRKQ